MVHHVFFSIISYDKINKNKKITHYWNQSVFYMFFTKNKMEPEGQQFGRTEWYMILKPIIFFVCVFLQIKKWHQTRNRYQWTERQNREKQNSTWYWNHFVFNNQDPVINYHNYKIGKDRLVHDIDIILFSQLK